MKGRKPFDVRSIDEAIERFNEAGPVKGRKPIQVPLALQDAARASMRPAL